MKRLAVIVAVFLVGLGALLYPVASDHLARQNSSAAIQAYADKVAALGESELEALWRAAEEYNQSLTGQPVRDPFLAGSGMARTADYEQVLNVGGIMGHVDIPKIGLRLPIYHGTSPSVLEKGAGHLEGSTLPIGGVPRHTVITGHTGLSSARLFSDLAELGEGDQFYFHVLGQTLAYEVNQITVIEPHQTDDLKRVADRDWATLLTCTPYSVNSHRLLVRGERVDFDRQAHDTITPLLTSAVDRMTLTAGAATAGIMLLLIIVVALARKRRESGCGPDGGWREDGDGG